MVISAVHDDDYDDDDNDHDHDDDDVYGKELWQPTGFNYMFKMLTF